MVKIFVGNVPDGAREADLRAMFEKYGTVSECSILSAFAFVHMDSQDDAYAAVKAIDGSFFSGQTIKVEFSHGKSSRGGRGGRGGGFRDGRGGGGGYRGGRDRDYDSRDRGYSRHDPYERDPYARDPYARDPYARDPYARDPYARRPPPRDPYERRPPPRDPYYARDPYAARDSYAARDPYARDPYASRAPADPYARDRSPMGKGYGGGSSPPQRRSYDTSGYDVGARSGSPSRRY